MNKKLFAAWLIVGLAFLVSVVFYKAMPERIASHWNLQGETDGYMNRFWGLFIMPVTLFILLILFQLIPKIDPLKRNFVSFRTYYDIFILFFLGFMMLIHLHIIFWNLGWKISPNLFMPIALGFFFYYAGILCGKAKRNWFVGLRTPWTLSSDIVWDKTHIVTAKLFKICGIISVLGALSGNIAIYISLIPIIMASIFATIYSYIIYKKEVKKD
jgi:uncharacterized membrane protein